MNFQHNSKECTVQSSVKLTLFVILDLHCIRMIGDIFKCNMFHRDFSCFKLNVIHSFTTSI